MPTRDVRIAMMDGIVLAATLYLPELPEAPGRVPCLLEALPYRKDDVTASYTAEYERLRDEFGYAVCRVDLRGTGSSTGIATDEYPEVEQRDLVEVIAWLAAQPWCTGRVGMYGTSYSGFNSIQVATHRPPALGAIVPIYATDDRYTDDVHYMGGVRRLLDIVDYPTYMVAMNALPPVPELFGSGWREEWRRRRAEGVPWLLRWGAEPDDGAYWRHGSLRPDYGRITAPTMIVAGWADGYRNNTLRTHAALTAAGTPVRLLVGPWSHMSAESALPGPHVDLCAEMARWFDRWLRDAANGVGASTDTGPDAEPSIVYFSRTWYAPEPDAPTIAGTWQAEHTWPSPRVGVAERPLGGGTRTHKPVAGTGTAAWNSCAGQLPWGQPTDQRYDDAASLTWQWPAGGTELLGHATLALRLRSDQPVSTVSAKLCDVAPDGTSVLVTRALLNLAHRDGLGAGGVHGTPPAPLPVGEDVDVELEFEATAWTVAPGHLLRLAVTGMDWPNTLAAPRPFTLVVDGDASRLRLPVASGPPDPAPATLHRLPDPDGGVVTDAAPAPPTWRISDDVLTRTTSAYVEHGSTYPARGGTCTDHYTGLVSIDRRTWRQRATSSASFQLDLGGTRVRTEATVAFTADEHQTTIEVTLDAYEGDHPVAKRTWRDSHPRRLA
ncbi:MAG TPA: CocE/NonD family hydrolase [Micromonosporaceae bacterium]|nr:CocE/NonD family hydrolase [Micromonosporaceae bacterium]